jgi:hypothetical protein
MRTPWYGPHSYCNSSRSHLVVLDGEAVMSTWSMSSRTNLILAATLTVWIAATLDANSPLHSAPDDPCADYLHELRTNIDKLSALVKAQAAAPQLIAALDAIDGALQHNNLCASTSHAELPPPKTAPEQITPAKRPTPGELMARIDPTHRSASTSQKPASIPIEAEMTRLRQLLREARAESSTPMIDYQAVNAIVQQLRQQLTTSPSTP